MQIICATSSLSVDTAWRQIAAQPGAEQLLLRHLLLFGIFVVNVILPHICLCVCAGKNMLILVPVTMVATTAVAR